MVATVQSILASQAARNIPQPAWQPRYPHPLLGALPASKRWVAPEIKVDQHGLLQLPQLVKDPCGDPAVSAATAAGFLFASAPRGSTVAYYTANDVLADGQLTSRFPSRALARFYDKRDVTLQQAFPGLQDNPGKWGVPDVASRALQGAAAVYVAIDPFAHLDEIGAAVVAGGGGLALDHLETLARNVAWALKNGGEFRAADTRLAVAGGQQSQAIFLNNFLGQIFRLHGLDVAWSQEYVAGAGLTYFVYAKKA